MATRRSTREPSTAAATAEPQRIAKRAPAEPAQRGGERGPAVDLHALGARVLSVFGPFNSRVLIDMSADTAALMFPSGFGAAGPSRMLEAAEREIAVLREKSPDLADSALAAMVVAMAFEIEHPYNSATSKSACAKALQDALRELRELAPAEEAKDGVDEIAEQRARRRGSAATKG